MKTLITLACSLDIVDEGNQLAAALAESLDDTRTFGGASHQNASGDLFSVTSLNVSPEWFAASEAGVTRPAWDVAQEIDMAQAQAGHAALVVWQGVLPMPLALPGKLTVIPQVDRRTALAGMGLSEYVTD